MKLYVGTSGYAYPAWKGKFYPDDLPAKKMLNYYGQHFSTVEINNSFYRLPDPAIVKSWAREVPTEFRFILKAPQQITHFRRLKDVAEPLQAFLDVAAVLKERLGGVLFQLPPNFKKDLGRLQDFLGLLPRKSRVAFEFRHPSWFDEEVFAVLRKRRIALCLAEAENDLEVPFVATADWGYVRLRQESYDDSALREWVKPIKAANWSEAFVFFKHEDEGTGPRFARRFLELSEPRVSRQRQRST